MTAAPSQTPEAAGLEVVGWVKRINESHPINLAQPSDWKFTPHKPVLSEGLQAEWFDEREVVTAASAQAAIDAEKAKVAELEALVSKSCDLSVEQTDKLLAMHERATAAEAELAKVRKALNRTRDPHWTLFYVKEALQQETQP